MTYNPARTLAIAALVVAAIAACIGCTPPPTHDEAPVPPQVLGQLRYTCDEVNMPGNESNWCDTWTRPNGMVVTGAVSRHLFELANPKAYS